MALAQAQRAFATLATDEAGRARLRDDPAAFAREFALTPAELAHLRALDAAGLPGYVASLERKRVGEAVRLLPLSARLRGPALRRAFAAHARRRPLGSGPARYVRDVVAFADAARHEDREPPVLRELLDFEASGLRATSARSFARVRCYAFPVARLARAVASGAPLEGSARRRTIVVWLTLFGRSFVAVV